LSQKPFVGEHLLPEPGPGRTGWPWTGKAIDEQTASHVADCDLPLISIITPNLNSAKYLEECIRSVLLQDYPHVELVVIDGGSDDGSVDLIRKYEQFLKYWISEPDSGQSEAINKGFSQTSGLLVNWLNADDMLLPGALRAIGTAYFERFSASKMEVNRRALVVLSLVRNLSLPDGRAWVVDQGLLRKNIVRFWNQPETYHQPGIFLARSLWEQAGGLDEGLHCCMDYELYCKIHPFAEFISTDAITALFRVHQDQKTARLEDALIIEKSRSSKRYWQREKVGRIGALAHDAFMAKSIAHRVSARGLSFDQAISTIQRLCSATGAPVVLALGRFTASRIKRFFNSSRAQFSSSSSD
jgi:glycosyltransferase involved in cell wall biosynthesis